MTCTEPMRNEVIDELMIDAGLWNAPEIRATLDSLASLAAFAAPRPGPELAAMLAGPPAAPAPLTTTSEAGVADDPAAAGDSAPAGDPAESVDPAQPDELGRRRRLRKNRPIVVGAVVVATMGLGVSGVAAATAGLTGEQQNIFQRLISHWVPAWAPAPPTIQQPLPTPDSPGIITVPSSGAVPPIGPATGSDGHESGSSRTGSGQPGNDSQTGKAPAGQTGQEKPAEPRDSDGRTSVKVSGQATADGGAAVATATKAAAGTTATSSTAGTTTPFVLLKSIGAASPLDGTSLPSWLATLTRR